MIISARVKIPPGAPFYFLLNLLYSITIFGWYTFGPGCVPNIGEALTFGTVLLPCGTGSGRPYTRELETPKTVINANTAGIDVTHTPSFRQRQRWSLRSIIQVVKNLCSLLCTILLSATRSFTNHSGGATESLGRQINLEVSTALTPAQLST